MQNQYKNGYLHSSECHHFTAYCVVMEMGVRWRGGVGKEGEGLEGVCVLVVFVGHGGVGAKVAYWLYLSSCIAAVSLHFILNHPCRLVEQAAGLATCHVTFAGGPPSGFCCDCQCPFTSPTCH